MIKTLLENNNNDPIRLLIIKDKWNYNRKIIIVYLKDH